MFNDCEEDENGERKKERVRDRDRERGRRVSHSQEKKIDMKRDCV